MPSRSPSKHLSLLLSLLALAAGVLCYRTFWSRPDALPDQPRHVRKPGPTPKPKLKLDFDTLHRLLAERYMLWPDRRVATAIGDVHHLLTGQPLDTKTLGGRRDGTRMTLFYRHAEAGSLSELPDFPEAIGLLTEWTRRVQKDPAARPMVPTSAQEAPTPSTGAMIRPLLQTLQKLDERWRAGQRVPHVVAAAAAGFAWLAFVTADRMEVADDIATRALTLLAIERANGLETTRIEALLAEGLGYHASALKTAASLAKDDPLRQYIERDDAALEQAALAGEAGEEARYLWLRRLVDRQDAARFEALLPRLFPGQRPDLSLLGLRALLGDFDVRVDSGETLAAATFEAACDGASMPEQELLSRFEQCVAQVDKDEAGQLLEAQTRRLAYRALFYTGLRAERDRLIGDLGTREGAQDLLTRLGPAKEPYAADFYRWYKPQVDLQFGHHVLGDVFHEISRPQLVGGHPLKDLYEFSTGYIAAMDSDDLKELAGLHVRLDTRVSHRFEAMKLAWTKLADLLEAQKLAESILRDAPSTYPYAERTAAVLRGDTAALQKVLSDPATEPSIQIEWLHRFQGTARLDDAFLRQKYLELAARHPDEYVVIDAVLDFLGGQKDDAKGIELGRAWLQRNEQRARGLEGVLVRLAVANLLYEQGRYQESWDELGPVMGSGQGGVMNLAGVLSLKLGQIDRADDIARAALERYPEASSIADLARVRWFQGRNTDAAKILGNKRAPPKAWRDLYARRFWVRFEGQPEQALAAFDELLKAGIEPESLAAFAAGVAAKSPELGFEMLSRIKDKKTGRIQFPADGYEMLLRLKGEDEALRWLKPQITPDRADPFMVWAYRQGYDRMLWEVLPAPRGQKAEVFWVLRAASAVRAGLQKHPHRDELLEHFRTPGTGFYRVVGRHLLGLASRSELDAVCTGYQSAGIAAYFIGVLEQHQERNDAEALRWYRLSYEALGSTAPEASWAYDQLSAWRNSSLSLAELQAKGL
jgi:hypothetical protein